MKRRAVHHLLLGLFATVAAAGCALPGSKPRPELPPRPLSGADAPIALDDALQPPELKPQPTMRLAGYVQPAASTLLIEQTTEPEMAQLAGASNHAAQGQADRENVSENLADVDEPSSETSDSAAIVSQTARDAAPVQFYVTRALSSHPKLIAARLRVAAAQQRVPQARSLTDPMLTETFWPFNGNALETAGGRAANQITISQAVPWPEKLAAKAAIACREVQMAQAEVQRLELEIEESVQLACFEVWFATEAIAVIDETRLLVEDLNDVAEARYRSGGSQQDVLRAQLEKDRLAEKRAQLLAQKQMAQADLAALLNAPQSSPMDVTDVVAPMQSGARLSELIALAESSNPALRGLAVQIARDRERQRLARLQEFPDFQLGMSWLMIADRDALSPVANGNDNFGFTIGMTLPIWREKINAGIREAGYQTASSANMLSSERSAIAGSLRRLLAQADGLLEQREIYTERIIPRTEDTLELALADYRGKRADFMSLIEIYRELLMVELQVTRLNATLAGILAQIERQVGASSIQTSPVSAVNQ